MDRQFKLYNINKNGIAFIDVESDVDYIEDGQLILCMESIVDVRVIYPNRTYRYDEIEKFIIE